jgi:hypothetical protein
MITQDLSGDGVVIIDGQNVETVYYWLTVVPEAGQEREGRYADSYGRPPICAAMPRRSKRDARGAMHASSLAVQRGKVSMMHRG